MLQDAEQWVDRLGPWCGPSRNGRVEPRRHPCVFQPAGLAVAEELRGHTCSAARRIATAGTAIASVEHVLSRAQTCGAVARSAPVVISVNRVALDWVRGRPRAALSRRCSVAKLCVPIRNVAGVGQPSSSRAVALNVCFANLGAVATASPLRAKLTDAKLRGPHAPEDACSRRPDEFGEPYRSHCCRRRLRWFGRCGGEPAEIGSCSRGGQHCEREIRSPRSSRCLRCELARRSDTRGGERAPPI